MVKGIFWNLWFLGIHHPEGPGSHFLGLRDEQVEHSMVGTAVFVVND